MCCEISSTAAASRAGSRDIPPMRRRTCSLHSCMLRLRDSMHRLDERGPGAAANAQRLPARRREAVVAAPALRGLLDPAPLEQALCLQAIEQRIEGRDVEPQGAA